MFDLMTLPYVSNNVAAIEYMRDVAFTVFKSNPIIEPVITATYTGEEYAKKTNEVMAYQLGSGVLGLALGAVAVYAGYKYGKSRGWF